MSLLFNRKCCATCEMWQGARELDAFKTHVRTEQGNIEGRCMDRKKDSQAGYGGCTHYSKWKLLK